MRSLVVGLALVTAGLLARPAQACGGFFCSNTPINQSGERIVFAVADDHVQAHVQITYAGDAQKFAWVVPLHARPTLSIGSPSLFSYLDSRSQPVFQLDWSGAGECQRYYPVAEDASAGGSIDAGSPPGGVTVLSRENVGPYDTAILSATDAAALSGWLHANEYDLTPEGDTALAGYVGDGSFFVALRLQQDKSVGDLRPIVLDFDGGAPCIPIRLTAIAATTDMPITAFVLGDARAVPTNYRHVLINEARLDWLGYSQNYRQIATAAVDEAGGRAFLTEYAGTLAAVTGGQKLSDGSLSTATLATKTDPVDFVLELQAENFPRDGLLDMLRRYVPEPAALVGGTSEQQFYNQIAQYRQAIADDPDRLAFDAPAFAHELDETVIQPLARAQAMLDAHPYLTRLFTTMSAAEMTVDPEFAFNTGLPNVSNVHTAKLVCNGTDKASVTLADGRTFEATFGGGALSAGPAAERIEQLSSIGGPALVTDNTKAIDDALPRGAAACGCSGVESAGALALLAAVLRRRRGTVVGARQD